MVSTLKQFYFPKISIKILPFELSYICTSKFYSILLSRQLFNSNLLVFLSKFRFLSKSFSSWSRFFCQILLNSIADFQQENIEIIFFLTFRSPFPHLKFCLSEQTKPFYHQKIFLVSGNRRRRIFPFILVVCIYFRHFFR